MHRSSERDQSTMRYAMCLAAAISVIPLVAHADDAASYQKAVDSVVSIVCESKGELHGGTGVVLATDNVVTANGVIRGSVVLTAEHVVSGQDKIAVFFPLRDSVGAVIGDREPYAGRGRACVVLKTHHARDLAVLLVRHTEKAVPIELSSGARPGEQVFTIGAGGTHTLFHYAAGVVSQSYRGSYQFEKTHVNARLLEITIPINGGDSGGPVLSQAGKLVGINLAMDPKKNLVNKAVDISEITAFLNEMRREREEFLKSKK